MIYLYIWSDKKRGVQLFQYLRRKGKAYQSRSKDEQAGRGFIKNRVSVDDKSAKSVTTSTIALLQPFKDMIFTITADNNNEFAYHEVMIEYLNCGVYFADPYCSWQRGLNENTNGLLRQYWPKSMDLKKYLNQKLKV